MESKGYSIDADSLEVESAREAGGGLLRGPPATAASSDAVLGDTQREGHIYLENDNARSLSRDVDLWEARANSVAAPEEGRPSSQASAERPLATVESPAETREVVDSPEASSARES